MESTFTRSKKLNQTIVPNESIKGFVTIHLIPFMETRTGQVIIFEQQGNHQGNDTGLPSMIRSDRFNTIDSSQSIRPNRFVTIDSTQSIRQNR